jgi:hypothetical protein
VKTSTWFAAANNMLSGARAPDPNLPRARDRERVVVNAIDPYNVVSLIVLWEIVPRCGSTRRSLSTSCRMAVRL